MNLWVMLFSVWHVCFFKFQLKCLQEKLYLCKKVKALNYNIGKSSMKFELGGKYKNYTWALLLIGLSLKLTSLALSICVYFTKDCELVHWGNNVIFITCIGLFCQTTLQFGECAFFVHLLSVDMGFNSMDTNKHEGRLGSKKSYKWMSSIQENN